LILEKGFAYFVKRNFMPDRNQLNTALRNAKNDSIKREEDKFINLIRRQL